MNGRFSLIGVMQGSAGSVNRRRLHGDSRREGRVVHAAFGVAFRIRIADQN